MKIWSMYKVNDWYIWKLILFLFLFSGSVNTVEAQNNLIGLKSSGNVKDSILAKSFFKFGVRAYKLGRYDSSIFYINKAIEFNNSNYLYYGYNGLAKRELKRYSDALVLC